MPHRLEHPVPLRVGIDFDGVIYDYVTAIRRAAYTALAIVFDPDLRSPADDEVAQFVGRLDPEPEATHWHFYKDWGISGSEFAALNRWAIKHANLFSDSELDPAWGEVLVELRHTGHTLHGVTHRSLSGAISQTEQWLQREKIADEFESITFVSNTAAKSYTTLDVLIDDKHENIAEWMATGRPGIIYDRPWNKHSNTGAFRAFNPQHVAAIIGTISTMRKVEQDNAVEEEAETILQEAQRLVHGDRGADYGHPIDDFTRTGAYWGVTLNEWRFEGDRDEEFKAVPPELVALCMIDVKKSREINRPKRDNRTDIAGYAETLDMVRQEQES